MEDEQDEILNEMYNGSFCYNYNRRTNQLIYVCERCDRIRSCKATRTHLKQMEVWIQPMTEGARVIMLCKRCAMNQVEEEGTIYARPRSTLVPFYLVPNIWNQDALFRK